MKEKVVFYAIRPNIHTAHLDVIVHEFDKNSLEMSCDGKSVYFSLPRKFFKLYGEDHFTFCDTKSGFCKNDRGWYFTVSQHSDKTDFLISCARDEWEQIKENLEQQLKYANNAIEAMKGH